MEVLSRSLGIPLNCILPVKNYNLKIDTDGDIDALSALRQIITQGEDFLNDRYSKHTNCYSDAF